MTTLTKWSVDPAHSEIAFKVKHLLFSHVKGTFKKFSANIYSNGKDFSKAQIDLEIDPSSIETGDAECDEHLRGADFFDVKTFNQIIFTSSSIEKSIGDNNYELLGKLTIKVMTSNVKFNIRFEGIIKELWGEKVGFTVTGKIKRSDWGLVWSVSNEANVFRISDEITIVCQLEFINKDFLNANMETESNFQRNSFPLNDPIFIMERPNAKMKLRDEKGTNSKK